MALSQLKKLDFYPKLNDEVVVRTVSGAGVSICALTFIVMLFLGELSIYLRTETIHHLHVDTSRGEKMQINFDVTFPHIPCSLLSLDAMDVSGSHQLDISHSIQKKSLDKDGNAIGPEVKHELLRMDEKEVPKDPTKEPGYCGSCYGAEERPGQCCNSCDDVKAAYRSKGWAMSHLGNIEQCVAAGETGKEIEAELAAGFGCQMWGQLLVNKVQGNFHFAPGKSFQHAHMHIHDLGGHAPSRFNVSHTINRLSFGEDFPGIVNPLDKSTKILPSTEDGSGMFQYYVKVVPTTYQNKRGSLLVTNQFSVTEHYRKLSARDGQGLPGVFIFYELSPIMVRFQETSNSFLHFLTQLCAVVGGVFTIAGMIDRLIFKGMKMVEAKMELGKLS